MSNDNKTDALPKSAGLSEEQRAEETLVNTEEVAMPSAIPEMELIPGKVYRGSFWISPHGEINVRPQREGTQPNGMKKECEGDYFSIFSSKNCVRCVITMPRTSHYQLRNILMQAVTDLTIKLFQYQWVRK